MRKCYYTLRLGNFHGVRGAKTKIIMPARYRFNWGASQATNETLSFIV